MFNMSGRITRIKNFCSGSLDCHGNSYGDDCATGKAPSKHPGFYLISFGGMQEVPVPLSTFRCKPRQGKAQL